MIQEEDGFNDLPRLSPQPPPLHQSLTGSRVGTWKPRCLEEDNQANIPDIIWGATAQFPDAWNSSTDCIFVQPLPPSYLPWQSNKLDGQLLPAAVLCTLDIIIKRDIINLVDNDSSERGLIQRIQLYRPAGEASMNPLSEQTNEGTFSLVIM